MQEKQNSFLKGAAILGIAGIIVKVMGVFFRIPLTNWIGAEGMSYYSSVYPIYSFFLLISLPGMGMQMASASFRVCFKKEIRKCQTSDPAPSGSTHMALSADICYTRLCTWLQPLIRIRL